MASSFAEGFVTGFANTLADGINERTTIARDYFQKQYEIATTVGMENYRKTESQAQASAKVAKQLQQMGVPRDVIMAVASQDPMSLPSFYEEIANAQAAGVPLDEEFFNDFVQVSKDFKAPDEDFYTFFKKAMSPIKRVAEADPEGLKADKKGGIFAALLGADPYGRAQKKLDETIVLDGMSASDLAKYGSTPPAGVDNAPTVTYDYSKVKKPKSSDLSISDVGQLEKAIEEERMALRTENPTMSNEDARQAAIEKVKERYANVPDALIYLDQLSGAPSSPGVPQEGDITTSELPPSGQELADLGIDGLPNAPSASPETPPSVPSEPPATPVAPVTEAAPTAPTEPPAQPPSEITESNEPIDPEGEGLFRITINGVSLFWAENLDDGTVLYLDDKDTPYVFDPAEVRTFVKQFGTEFRK